AKTAVTVKLTAPSLKFDFKGTAASAAEFALDGDTALDISSLRELAAWTGGSLPPTSGGLAMLKIGGKLAVAGSRVKFTQADFALTVGGIIFKKITIGKSALTVQLKDSKLAADLTQMELYQGTGKGGVRLDGAAAVPAFEGNFDLAKVEAQPILRDVMDFDRL